MDMDPEVIIKEEALDADSLDLESLIADDLMAPQPLEIGSRNSAFQPYKPLTILTNLQRGNVKTLCRDAAPPHPLTFQEKAAKGSLVETDIDDSNVNSMDSDGLTALMWAAFHGKLLIVEALVAKGAEVNCTGPDGQTALMFASSKGHTEVLNYLISKGAEVEAEDDFGNTALMHAAHLNQSQSVSELLAQGASMTKPNFIGDNAFEIAFSKGSKAAQYVMELHLKRILESNCVE